MSRPRARAVTPGPTTRPRQPVRARRGPVERHEDAVLDLLGQVVLERAGETIGLVPRVAEHVGKESLDDAVPPDGRDRGLPARRRQLDPAVGLVVDEPAVGEALHGRGHRAGREPEPLGEDARMGVAIAGKEKRHRYTVSSATALHG